MAKSSMKLRTLASFKMPMKVEVRQPEFEPLSSLSALDLDRLSKGNHKVEIGFVHGGSCRQLVRAVIRNGMVTGCEVEPCEDSGIPPSKEMVAVFTQVQKRLKTKKWKPIPIRDLVSNTARMQSLIIWGGGCILICIFDFCIMCCWWPRPHCFRPIISTGPL